VAADEADHLALGYVEIQVAQGPEGRDGGFGSASENVGDGFAQGAVARGAAMVGLAQATDADRRGHQITSAKDRSMRRKAVMPRTGRTRATPAPRATSSRANGVPSRAQRHRAITAHRGFR